MRASHANDFTVLGARIEPTSVQNPFWLRRAAPPMTVAMIRECNVCASPTCLPEFAETFRKSLSGVAWTCALSATGVPSYVHIVHPFVHFMQDRHKGRACPRWEAGRVPWTRCHPERVRVDSKSRAEMGVELCIPIGSYFPLRIKGRGKCRSVVPKIPTEGSVLPKAFADLFEYGGAVPGKIPHREPALEDLRRAG